MPRSSVSKVVGYALLLGAAAASIWWIRSVGNGLQAPPPVEGTPVFGHPTKPVGEEFFHVLLALIAILLASRGLGAIFAKLQQPPVIGEMFAGIMIGPSLLGRFAPDVSQFLLPPTIAPYLGVIAQIGVVLFMFLVGLELDTSGLKKRPQAAIGISQASMVLPFVLGCLLALYVYPRFATSDVPFFVFALFMGISMSVTAFPVLARILTDRKLSKTRLGVIALSCAAIDDVTAWCLLALVVSIAKSVPSEAAKTAGLTILFVAVMVFVARPLIRRWIHSLPKDQQFSQARLGLVFIGFLLSALTTEAIGIHALFGAFIFGTLIPHDSPLARDLTARLNDAVLVLFLPAFFAFTGMRMQINLVEGQEAWFVCGLILLVATLGKFGGSYVAARFAGLAPRDSATIGVLMNTRGLMELVVLNIGLDLGVISPALFAMLVLMALITTFATSPVLTLLYRGRSVQESFEGSERIVP
ncbi:MAG TPA: cation:proton antiporter [Planctomycetota bacterium]|nr:cation:proton antiporter [Planctomycetota bacterium]